jgi:hypothetical protein
MKIILGCEESQAVTLAFRELGHEAYSCDVLPCSGGHPEWHLHMDVFKAINLKSWDMMICFPPCTHLSVSGAKHFEKKRADGRQEEVDRFFLDLQLTGIEKTSTENPVGIMSGAYILKHYPHLEEKLHIAGFPRKPDQIIQPYQYGHPESKSTCLWLKGLPLLQPTNVLSLPEKGYWDNQTKSGQNKLGPSEERAALRAKTYTGIAQAMAAQWIF